MLRGQGGLGKSTLARRYAEVHGGDYDGVVWVEAVSRQGIIEGLVALCAHVDLPVPDAAQIQHAQAVLGKIGASNQSWLFIYDNVEAYADLKGLSPPRGAHLIVTTRQGEGWPGFEVMPLERLDFGTENSPAVILLMEEAGRKDGAAEARSLAEDLGGLPLALVVAGSLIRSTGEGFAAYGERLSDILDHAPANEDYPTSVLGAVQLSYDQLSENARIVADLCAWWAPEGLEPGLLTEAPQGWDWDDRREDITEDVQALAAEPGRVRAGFAELTSRSLMESGDGHWSMHRMTAAALRRLQAERGDADTARAAAALLAAVYPGGVDRDVNNSKEWPLCARLTPHVRVLWASGAAPETEAMDFLLGQAAVYLDKIADFPGGLEMARASLALRQKRLPEAHRDIAVGFATLGIALMKAGELKEAEAQAARAVDLDETHRPDSMGLAVCYDQHGGVLLAQARAGDAAALVKSLRRRQQALVLFRRLDGRDSEATARALNNLANVRSQQGRTLAAARLSAVALAIRRQVLDPGDARLGFSLLSTGAYWLKSGSAASAEPLLRETLEIRKTVFAAQPQHPETRNAADWLILCLLTLARAGDRPDARQAEARALCERYGFDFAEQEEMAKQFPLQPPEA
ncbi:MAG: tetratricopeptide repeat protein [Hoeflea sp.]|uniref:tetratricopeptide repeat protein n=1 Tax=Hoeflea sp. TaxID=1940281 RepID=UPI0032EAF9AD